MSINSRLKVIRQVAGLSQTSAAGLLGVHQVTLARREGEGYTLPEGFLSQARRTFDPYIRERSWVSRDEKEEVA